MASLFKSLPEGPQSSCTSAEHCGRAPGLSRHLSRFSACVLAVVVVLSAEAVGIAVIQHAQFAGPWELRVALTRLVPIALLAGVPLALVGTLSTTLLDLPVRLYKRIGLGLIAAATAAAIGWGVTTGPAFRHFALRVGAVVAFALGSAVATYLLAPLLARFRQRSTGPYLLLLVVAIVASLIANAKVLPRLYPAFHMGLAAITVVLGSWTGDLLWRYVRARVVIASALIVVIASAAGMQYAARDLASRDNVRVLYLSHAPMLSYAVRLAAELAPPEDEADPELSRIALQRAAEQQRWVDWKGRDIVLLTIDALRADHLGAYGYHRPTSPNIDALAREGVLFERAYCAMPHTSYSLTSIMTGKYMRPLVLQRTGQDSDTFAGLLRVYGYRTASFYPPSVFSVDPDHFAWAEKNALDFEYRKVEYAIAAHRHNQVLEYLQDTPASRRVFIWAHYFEPHEPYDAHPEYDFGDRDIDRYDGEIALTDAIVGKTVQAIREQRPQAVIIISGDHGEEFGDHGGYYHGTTVYEEQVRVPLIVVAPGLKPARISEPVQTIDVLPTVLHALDIPRTPRLRGNDLGAWLVGKGKPPGVAFAESDDQTLLAMGQWRLVCERKIDACSLYDIVADPQQRRDRTAQELERVGVMRTRLREIEASHGRYELAGARQEGKSLPPALVRGIAGDAEAAPDVAALLDDADVIIRRRAAEVLFDLRDRDTSEALSLALTRDEDEQVRRWSALGLVRLGHGAPMVEELLAGEDETWQRLAALALADAGDGRGEPVLVQWWQTGGMSFQRAKEVLGALGRIQAKSAVVPLTRSLDDLRLRPFIATALGAIGDPFGRIALLNYFAKERYVDSRKSIAEALVQLGATREMAPSLGRFLGVPDPLVGGLHLAVQAGITDALGGPNEKQLAKLRAAGSEGMALRVLPPKGGNGKGFRVLVRARLREGQTGAVRIGPARSGGLGKAVAPAASRLVHDQALTLEVRGQDWSEVHKLLPEQLPIRAQRPFELVVVPDRNVEIDAFVVVPLADEIPPPPPEAWTPEEAQEG